MVTGPRAPLLGGSTVQTFHYDELGQLTSANGTAQFSDGRSQSYALAMEYDAIHNITKKVQSSITRLNGAVVSQDDSATHELAYDYTGAVHRTQQLGDQAFTYDANGNRTEVLEYPGGPQLARLAWNSEDRVTEIENDQGLSTFRYDSSGERTHRVTRTATTLYANAYYVVRDETYVSKHIYAGSQRIASVFNDNGVAWANESRRWYHTDHLQSTQWVTNETGAPTEHIEQLPFGEQWVEESSGSDTVAYRFTGKELDRETGLYYFGARYYDPRAAQWVSPDPILADAFVGTIDGGLYVTARVAVYTYVANAPLVLRDPDGRDFIDALASTLRYAFSMFAGLGESPQTVGAGAGSRPRSEAHARMS